jgi:hypothetical protein
MIKLEKMIGVQSARCQIVNIRIITPHIKEMAHWLAFFNRLYEVLCGSPHWFEIAW